MISQPNEIPSIKFTGEPAAGKLTGLGHLAQGIHNYFRGVGSHLGAAVDVKRLDAGAREAIEQVRGLVDEYRALLKQAGIRPSQRDWDRKYEALQERQLAEFMPDAYAALMERMAHAEERLKKLDRIAEIPLSLEVPGERGTFQRYSLRNIVRDGIQHSLLERVVMIGIAAEGQQDNARLPERLKKGSEQSAGRGHEFTSQTICPAGEALDGVLCQAGKGEMARSLMGPVGHVREVVIRNQDAIKFFVEAGVMGISQDNHPFCDLEKTRCLRQLLEWAGIKDMRIQDPAIQAAAQAVTGERKATQLPFQEGSKLIKHAKGEERLAAIRQL